MIREAVIADARAIAEIIVAAWRTAYEGLIDSSYPLSITADRFVRIMERNIGNSLETIFLYEREGVPVGFVSGTHREGPYDCEVVGLYVHPGYQGCGIGGALLDSIMERFRLEGRKRMIVWTLRGARNNPFYVRHGGRADEAKEIEIGEACYPGAGFVFGLYGPHG